MDIRGVHPNCGARSFSRSDESFPSKLEGVQVEVEVPSRNAPHPEDSDAVVPTSLCTMDRVETDVLRLMLSFSDLDSLLLSWRPLSNQFRLLADEELGFRFEGVFEWYAYRYATRDHPH